MSIVAPMKGFSAAASSASSANAVKPAALITPFAAAPKPSSITTPTKTRGRPIGA